MSHQSELIATDIEAYLAEHERKDLLRFLTCGSVDDGKSTLIGRLLHDSHMIYEDQLASLEADSTTQGSAGDQVDLALLTDGLKAEREQGITIDVAYRYFSTAKRKFIIADTPGHEQYTRNMVTGASTCQLAIILIHQDRKLHGPIIVCDLSACRLQYCLAFLRPAIAVARLRRAAGQARLIDLLDAHVRDAVALWRNFDTREELGAAKRAVERARPLVRRVGS